MTSKIDRQEVYNKYNGKCAYSGTDLKDDWQVDHIVPIAHAGTNDIDNLMPVQRIVNHYKRALTLKNFREWYLGGLHERLAKLPKNPRSENGIKKKQYLLDIAELFGITVDKPFDGMFYFEKIKDKK